MYFIAHEIFTNKIFPDYGICMYMYVYTHVCTHMYDMNVYVYMYIIAT